MPPIIQVENLSKLYRLGQIGTRSFSQSLARTFLRRKTPLHDASAHPEIDPDRLGPEPNSFWALRDVSFQVEQGEVLGIIGKNGAGKSTLLKILSRITEPTSGQALLHGRVASLLEVGTGFNHDLTGRENIYLNGTILGLKKREIDARLDEIVDFSGVEKFLDTPVKRFSSGMTVRLAFAVAAHLEPEVLIIDEVLAVGDLAFQRKCVGKMRSVAAGGRTVLFVSHQLALISTLCTRCLLLEGGRSTADGTVSDILPLYTGREATTPSPATIPDEAGAGYLLTAQPSQIKLASGDPLRFTVTISCPVTHRAPSLGFIAYNDLDQPVFGSSSKVQHVPFDGTAESWHFSCDLGPIPLCPSSLKISLWFGDMERDHAIFRNALSLEVEAADPFGTGIPIPQSWGNFFWTTHFTATPAAEGVTTNPEGQRPA